MKPIRNPNRKYSFVFFLLIICWKTNYFSQLNFKQSVLKIYDANSGLPNNSIQNTFQDSLGFIWISTAEALVRFDGRNFVSYYPNAQDSNCVSGNNWFSFAQTNKSEMWLVHNKGISIYSQASNTFNNILKTDGAFDNKNVLLGIDKTKHLWVLIINKGLVKINIITKRIEEND